MSWSEYFEKIKDRPARPLLKKALGKFEARSGSQGLNILPMALDLGCGPGTDSLYLLKNGWQVTAVEKESEGLKYLQSTLSPELAANLTVIETSFENLKALPKANLIYAFPEFWKVIESSFCENSVFAANFFGPDDDWVKAGRVTGHTEEGIREMLQDFSEIEIEVYKQVGPTALEGNKFWHSFEVIACR